MLESTLYHKGIIKGKNIYSRLDVSQLMLIIPKDVCDAIFPSSFISKLAQKTTIWNQDNFKKYILLFAPCTIMKSVCYKKTARCKLEDTEMLLPVTIVKKHFEKHRFRLSLRQNDCYALEALAHDFLFSRNGLQHIKGQRLKSLIFSNRCAVAARWSWTNERRSMLGTHF